MSNNLLSFTKSYSLRNFSFHKTDGPIIFGAGDKNWRLLSFNVNKEEFNNWIKRIYRIYSYKVDCRNAINDYIK